MCFPYYLYAVGSGGKQVLENCVVNVGGDGEAYFLTALQQRMWRTIRGGAVSSSPNQNLTSPFLSIIMPSFGSLTRVRGHSSIIPPRSPHCCCCWHHWQAQRLWLHPLAFGHLVLCATGRTFHIKNKVFHLSIHPTIFRVLHQSDLVVIARIKKSRIASGCIIPPWVFQWLQLGAYDDEQPSKCWHLCTLLGTLLQGWDTVITGIKFALAVYWLVTGDWETSGDNIVCWKFGN